MAENETLTCSGAEASRWLPIAEAIVAGQTDDVIFGEIQLAFYRGLRRACRQLAQRGVTLQALLEAALRSPEEFRRLLVQVRGHHYARVLEQVALAFSGGSLEGLVADYLHAIWDEVDHNLRMLVNPANGQAACPEVLSQLDRIQERIEEMIDRLARQLAEDASKIPPTPRRRRREVASTVVDILNQTLLGGQTRHESS